MLFYHNHSNEARIIPSLVVCTCPQRPQTSVSITAFMWLPLKCHSCKLALTAAIQETGHGSHSLHFIFPWPPARHCQHHLSPENPFLFTSFHLLPTFRTWPMVTSVFQLLTEPFRDSTLSFSHIPELSAYSTGSFLKSSCCSSLLISAGVTLSFTSDWFLCLCPSSSQSNRQRDSVKTQVRLSLFHPRSPRALISLRGKVKVLSMPHRDVFPPSPPLLPVTSCSDHLLSTLLHAMLFTSH